MLVQMEDNDQTHFLVLVASFTYYHCYSILLNYIINILGIHVEVYDSQTNIGPAYRSVKEINTQASIQGNTVAIIMHYTFQQFYV